VLVLALKAGALEGVQKCLHADMRFEGCPVRTLQSAYTLLPTPAVLICKFHCSQSDSVTCRHTPVTHLVVVNLCKADGAGGRRVCSAVRRGRQALPLGGLCVHDAVVRVVTAFALDEILHAAAEV
jgi:hypothetical protein